MKKIFLWLLLSLANAFGEANLSVNSVNFEQNSTNSSPQANLEQNAVSQENLNSHSNLNGANSANLNGTNSTQNGANLANSNPTNSAQTPIIQANSTNSNSPRSNLTQNPANSKKILTQANFDLVKVALAQEFRAQNPKIIIRTVELQTGSLPKNFAAYEFIKLGEARFVKASGYVRAVFKTPENTQKNVFFRYFIKAKVEVLRANRDIARGEVLASTDYSIVFYDFDKVPLWALEKDGAADLIARTAVRKHSILKQNMFKANHLVKPNTQLMAVLGDGEVKMSVEVAAIEAGNKGDTIKVKTKDGKVLQAVIIDKNQVSLK